MDRIGEQHTTTTEARREAERSDVHLLESHELVIDGVRLLGATQWTDFELAIKEPEGPISDVRRAMKMLIDLLNNYALIRTVEESAEPDNRRYEQGKTLQEADRQSSAAARVAARQAFGTVYRIGFSCDSPRTPWRVTS